MTIVSNENRLQDDKLASYWVSKDTGVSCVLCPHHCFLKEGEVGICRTRANKNGKLYALSYGYPCTMHVDPVEKKPLYHFMPGSSTFSMSTVGCNLRCLNCQNHTISQRDFKKEEFDYISPKNLVALAVSNHCQSMAYTYTDPVVYYEYVMDTAQIAKEQGIKNILVSAGYINKKPLRDLCSVLDAANIDLKCFDEDIYRRMTGVGLNHILDSLQVLLEEKVWLEITNLVVPSFSDDLILIKKMCKWLVANGFAHVPLHFSKFSPTNKLIELQPTSLSVLKQVYQIAQDEGVKCVYLGNITDTDYARTLCTNCGALLVERIAYRTISEGINHDQCKQCGLKIDGVWG